MLAFPRTAVLVTALMVGGLAADAGAQAINPFSRDMIGVSRQDMDKMREAIRAVLEGPEETVTRTWKNDETGVAGTVILLRRFERDGMPCGEVENVFTQPQNRRWVLPFCRVPEGRWLLAF